jgi:hypothetical protein
MPARVVESVHRLIEQHGKGAVYAAVERLNQSIGERDRSTRDFWVWLAKQKYRSTAPSFS